MNKWLDAPFFGSLHPACAQNKTLISNTAPGTCFLKAMHSASAHNKYLILYTVTVCFTIN